MSFHLHSNLFVFPFLYVLYGTVYILFNVQNSVSLSARTVSPLAPNVAAAWRQAGASQKFGREPKDAVPHKVSDEPRPACAKLPVGRRHFFLPISVIYCFINHL